MTLNTPNINSSVQRSYSGDFVAPEYDNRSEFSSSNIIQIEKTDFPDETQSSRIKNIVFNSLEIAKKDNKVFTVFLKALFRIVRKEISSGIKIKAFLVGGEVGNIREYKDVSYDIDTRCKVPKYTDKSVFNRIVKMIVEHFAERAGLTTDELANEEILKIVHTWNERDRFFTVTFTCTSGIKYDFNIVARLARKYLFFHDAATVALTPLMFSRGKSHFIVPQNLLDRGIDTIEYRRNKVLDTDQTETINFPGCIRLISNYVKGYVCKEHGLEKTLIDSLFFQLDFCPKNDLKHVIFHDIEEHHSEKYEAAVVFAFNFLTVLLRSSHEHRYDGIRDIFIEILLELEKKPLDPPLDAIESAIFAGFPSLIDLAREFPGVALEERKDIHSPLYQYQCGEWSLLYQKSPQIVEHSPVPEKVEHLPVLEKVEHLPVIDIQPKKKKSKSKGKKKLTIGTSNFQTVHSLTNGGDKRLIQELSKSRQSWITEEVYRLTHDLILYLEITKKLPPENHKIIGIHLKIFLKYLLNVDDDGSYCIPLCEQWIKHASFSKKLDKEIKVVLLRKWEQWLLIDREGEDKIDKIYTSFIDGSSIEISLCKIKTFLAANCYKKAKMIADKLKQNQIPNAIRLALLEGIEEPNTFEALELFVQFQNIILNSAKEVLFKKIVSDAVSKLIDGKLTRHKLDLLLDAGRFYKIVSGEFWKTVLSKAISNVKLYPKAVDVFFKTVVPCFLMEDSPQMGYECWKVLFSKMSETHDQEFKKLIENPQPIYNISLGSSPFDIFPLLNLLDKEAFHLLKNKLLTAQEELFVVKYLSQSTLSEQDVVNFMSLCLESSNKEHFKYGCKRLTPLAPDLKIDKLVELCSIIEKRACEFNEEYVRAFLKQIIKIVCINKNIFDRFNITATIIRECPSIKDVFLPLANIFIFKLQTDGIAIVKSIMDQAITMMTDIILMTNYPELADLICSVLLSEDYLKVTNKEDIATFWVALIKNTLDSYIKNPSKTNVLKGLDFFYQHVARIYDIPHYEFDCIEKAVTLINYFFIEDLPFYLKQVDKFYDFLAEGNPLGKLLPESEKLMQPIEDPFRFIRVHHVFIRNPYMIGADGNPLAFGSYVPPKNLAELQTRVFDHPMVWARYASGVSCLCKRLMNIQSISKEHDKVWMNLVYRSLESIMIQEAAIHAYNPDVMDIKRSYCQLLETYLSHSVFETAEMFATHLRYVSFLFSCAFNCGFLDTESERFLCYIFYLDKEIVASLPENPYDYEYVFSQLIKSMVQEGDAYQLFRIYIAFSENKHVLKNYSTQFKKDFTSAFKEGLKRFPHGYKDKEGFALGKAISEINCSLN